MVIPQALALPRLSYSENKKSLVTARDLGLQVASAVRTLPLARLDDESTIRTGARLDITHRRTAGDTGWLADRVGCTAEFTFQAAQSLRELLRSAQSLNAFADHSPDALI